MEMKLIKLSVISVALSVVSGQAMAEWTTKVEDDIFTGGQTAMMISGKTELSGVVFDCSKDTLDVTYVERTDSTKDIVKGLSADLIFKVDNYQPLTLNAQTDVRNRNYFGIVSKDSATQIEE